MKSPKVKMKYPSVLITWMDAAHFQGWEEASEIQHVEPKLCYSLGFILPTSTKDFIQLAQSYSDHVVADVLTIPIECVKKVKNI